MKIELEQDIKIDTFRFVENERELIVGIGSALVDILTHEQDEFLEKTGAAKGFH